MQSGETIIIINKMLTFVFISFLAFVFLWIFQKLNDRRKKLPPGPFRIPGFGNLFELLLADKHFHVAANKVTKKYGDIVYIKCGVVPSVVMNGYEACKQFLHSDDWLNRIDDKWTLCGTKGKQIGLIFGKDEIWRESRRLTMKYLRDFGWGKRQTMESAVQQEFDAFAMEIARKIENTNGKIESRGLFAPSFLNSVWTMVTGIRFDYEDPEFQKFLGYTHDWCKATAAGGGLLNAYPILSIWTPDLVGFSKIKRIADELRGFFEKMVKSYRVKGNYKTNPENFVDIFLKEIDENDSESGSKYLVFNDANLVAILFDLFLAGGDTSSSAMTFAVLYLILYPEVQNKVRDEIDRIVGQHRWPTMNDKELMPYTEATILEIMRVTSIVPVSARKAYKDIICGPYVFPKGINGIANLYGVHMDNTFWGDAQSFRPERFIGLNGNIINTNRERVIAFGLGKRNCFGETIAKTSIFMFVTRMIQNYIIEIDPSSKSPTREQVPGVVQSPIPFSFIIKPCN